MTLSGEASLWPHEVNAIQDLELFLSHVFGCFLETRQNTQHVTNVRDGVQFKYSALAVLL